MVELLQDIVANFHFLRPLWLLLFILLLPLYFILKKQKKSGGAWGEVCDAYLLRHLLVQGSKKSYNMIVKALILAFILAVFAMAGPTYKQLPQATFKGGTNTVFVLDMGLEMAARDVAPSRLDRAKFKLYDMLKMSEADQTALVLFDDKAYTVSPLSEDANVIRNIIPTIAFDVMPGNGASNVGAGIAEASNLLLNSKSGGGRIIVLTSADEVSGANALAAASEAAKNGNMVSVLAIGTPQGAPAPNPAGGFYSDATGKPVLFKLDIDTLEKVAARGNGFFSQATNHDDDLNKIMVMNLPSLDELTELENMADTWEDLGFYLLLPIIPLFLVAFRKGFIAVFFFLILSSNVSYAAEWWKEMWFNDSQLAAKSLKEQNYAEASAKLKDSSWKGYADYKAENYKDAVKELMKNEDETSLYNLGNSLAYAGDINAAIEAYEKAIKLNGNHKDAIFNRDYLKKQQEEQQKQQQNQEQQSQENQSSQNEENNNEEEKQSQAQQNEQENQEQQPEKEDSQSEQQEQKPDEQEQQNEQQQEKQDKQSEDEQKPEPNEQNGNKEPEQNQDKSQNTKREWMNQIPEDKGELLRARLKKIYQMK